MLGPKYEDDETLNLSVTAGRSIPFDGSNAKGGHPRAGGIGRRQLRQLDLTRGERDFADSIAIGHAVRGVDTFNPRLAARAQSGGPTPADLPTTLASVWPVVSLARPIPSQWVQGRMGRWFLQFPKRNLRS
jgi:hypothetical protein